MRRPSGSGEMWLSMEVFRTTSTLTAWMVLGVHSGHGGDLRYSDPGRHDAGFGSEPVRDMIRLLCWEGYDSPRVLERFERRSSTRVHARTLLSDAESAHDLLAGRTACDVLNINNAWIRGSLHPAGLVRELDPGRFEPHFERMLPRFGRLYRWARDPEGALIGICQRFGPFNLVVNTNRIDRASAEDQGFELANEPAARPYGILLYEDFNLFHVCIGAGLDPFSPLSDNEIARFEATARRWFGGAAIVSDDHVELNRALVDGAIDFYVSGGVYTASPARLAGHLEVRAVTPRAGPIGGRGGIVFTEITSVLETAPRAGAAEDFLEYLLEPETAFRAAFAERTANPVAQMGIPEVFERFSARELEAIQWDDLEEDIARCADYDLMPEHAVLLSRLRSAVRAEHA